MYRLKEDTMAELEIKKSRFLCYLHKSFSEADAKEFIQQIKKLHPNARHHCYAFIIGEQNELQRSNDDGEPQGTAGRPMLDVLLGEEVHNAAVVVTRYFGGTLLGTGGLVRAYSKSVQEGLRASKIIEKKIGALLGIRTDYNGLGKVQYLLGQRGLTITGSEYTDIVTVETLVPQAQLQELKEAITEGTNGRAEFIKEEAVCFAFVDGEPLIF